MDIFKFLPLDFIKLYMFTNFFILEFFLEQDSSNLRSLTSHQMFPLFDAYHYCDPSKIRWLLDDVLKPPITPKWDTHWWPSATLHRLLGLLGGGRQTSGHSRNVEAFPALGCSKCLWLAGACSQTIPDKRGFPKPQNVWENYLSGRPASCYSSSLCFSQQESCNETAAAPP